MEAGKLRHRLTIQQMVEVTDKYGERKGEQIPLTIDTVWGSLRALKGDELVEAQRVVAAATHEAVFRYHSGLSALTEQGQMVIEGVTYQIGFLDNWRERNIFCRAIVERRQ